MRVLETIEFSDWLSGLRDVVARRAIVRRLRLAATGEFGDAQALGDGVAEMRFHLGPGSRVYYTIRDGVVILRWRQGKPATRHRQGQGSRI